MRNPSIYFGLFVLIFIQIVNIFVSNNPTVIYLSTFVIALMVLVYFNQYGKVVDKLHSMENPDENLIRHLNRLRMLLILLTIVLGLKIMNIIINLLVKLENH